MLVSVRGHCCTFAIVSSMQEDEDDDEEDDDEDEEDGLDDGTGHQAGVPPLT